MLHEEARLLLDIELPRQSHVDRDGRLEPVGADANQRRLLAGARNLRAPFQRRIYAVEELAWPERGRSSEGLRLNF